MAQNFQASTLLKSVNPGLLCHPTCMYKRKCKCECIANELCAEFIQSGRYKTEAHTITFHLFGRKNPHNVTFCELYTFSRQLNA